MHTPAPAHPAAKQAPGLLVVLLLVLPWVQPWAPGPESNTVPLLISWAALALLLAMGRWPTAHELARAWVWAALASSAMGLLQYFGEAARLGGWVHVPAYLGDAVGNLRQRNQLATLTSLGAVALLWWRSQGLAAGHALWMLGLLALGNAATGSRTGLLQWLLLPALLLLWQGDLRRHQAPWSWRLLLWGLSVYLLATLALPQAFKLWTGTDIDSAVARMGALGGCGSRQALWGNVLHLIGQQPWTGWGWGELKYAHYMASYPGTRFCDILGNAHNLPLHLAFAFGIPAALALTLAVLLLLWRAKPWRVAPVDSLAWGVLAMVGLHSLLEYPLWYGPFQVATLASLVLLWPRARTALQAPGPLWITLGWAGLVLVLFVGADYQRARQVYLPPAQRWSIWAQDPWTAAERSMFFAEAVRFAQVTTTPVTEDNASAMLQASQALLHYSPEPRVIDKLIESARLAHEDALADWHAAQKAAVYGASSQ